MTPPTLARAARNPDRPRLLVARSSAIGDTILTTPVACRLRDWFPGAFLAWLVEEKSSAFVEDHPALDEVIVLPRGWFLRPRLVASLHRRLRALRLDATIDCQGMTKTALACWLSGAPLRVGLAGEHGRELSPWLNNRLVRPRRPHVTDRSLDLLEGLGLFAAADAPIDWRLPTPADSRARIQAWLAAAPIAGDYAVINPGASWDSKLWDNTRFADLAGELLERHGLVSVVVWGGQKERNMATAITNAAGPAAVMAPPTSLHDLAALLAGARLVVSPDTGPMHLGVAVGAPTVGLFGVTRPQDCGPYGPPHEAVQRRYQAGGRKERRQADNAAMLEITVEDAYTACRTVLDRSASAAPVRRTA